MYITKEKMTVYPNSPDKLTFLSAVSPSKCKTYMVMVESTYLAATVDKKVISSSALGS